MVSEMVLHSCLPLPLFFPFRYLANKRSIASQTECSSEMPMRVFGKKLQEQVEKWLSFCEIGESPHKTLEVTKEAPVRAEKEAAEMSKKLEKQKKRLLKKKKKCQAANALIPVPSENISSSPEECEKTFKEENAKAPGESSE